MPPTFRRIEAVEKAQGAHSILYVEKNLENNLLTPENIQNIFEQLETHIVPKEEEIFALLPKVINPDQRVQVLLTNLGSYQGYRFDGHFNPFDQMKEEIAWSENQQHSNEANIIYIDPTNARSLSSILAVIAHELQHLLAHHAYPGSVPLEQDSWLSETQAEAAMLFTGFFDDQNKMPYFSTHTNELPLVSKTYVQYGPQILFASFLIDSFDPHGGFSLLLKQRQIGREAVETLVEKLSSRVIPFDVIFSNFISYIFETSEKSFTLPVKWHRKDEGKGIVIPKLKRVGTVEKFPFRAKSKIAPYGFALFDTPVGLPADAEVILKPLNFKAHRVCQEKGKLLWKPLRNALAVYFVGCEYKSKEDIIDFEISVHEKP